MANVALSVTTDHAGAVKGIKLIGEGLEGIDAKAKKTSNVLTGIWQGFGQAGGSRILNEVLGMVDSISSAYSRNAERLQAQGKELNQINQLTGISTNRAQVYAKALDEVGRGSGSLSAGMNDLKKRLHEANDETTFAVSKLGLSMSDLKKSDPAKMFDDVVTALGKVENPTTRAGLAMKLMGENGATLAEIAPSLEAVEERLQRLGLAMAPEEWAGIEALRQGFEDVEEAQQGFWNQVVSGISSSGALRESLAAVSDTIAAGTRLVREHKEELRDLTEKGVVALSAAVEFLGNSALADGVTAIERYLAGALKIGEEWEKASARVQLGADLVTSAWEGIRASVGGVWDWLSSMADRVRNEFTTAFGAFLDRLPGPLEKVFEILGRLLGRVEDVASRVSGLAGDAASGLTGGIGGMVGGVLSKVIDTSKVPSLARKLSADLGFTDEFAKYNASVSGTSNKYKELRGEAKETVGLIGQAAASASQALAELRARILGAVGTTAKPGSGRPGGGLDWDPGTAARAAEAERSRKELAQLADRQVEGLSGFERQGRGFGFSSTTLDILPSEEALLDVKQKQLKADADLAAAQPVINALIFKRSGEQQVLKDATRAATFETLNWAQSLQSLSSMLTATGQAGSKFGSILGGVSGIGSILQGFQSKDKEGNLVGGLGGGFKNIFSSFGKGASGILQGISGVGALASAGLSIGKSIIGLFSGDPVKKAQKEIGKAIGHGVSRDIAESLMNEAKSTGKSLAQVAKEYEYQQAQEARQTMLEGLGVTQGGAEELMKWVPWARPEVALGAGKMFGSVFWKTWQEQGIEGLEKMRPIWEDAVAKMTEAGLDPTALGMGSIGAIMAATDNERFRAAAGMSSGAQQILEGATSGNFVDQQMIEGSVAIAEEQLNASREAHLSDKDAFTGMAGLLQAQLNASVASGEAIPSDLQALLDEAKRNGISIIADPTIRTAVATEGIYAFLTGQNGSSQASPAPAWENNGSTYDEGTGQVTWGPRPSGYPGGAPWPPVEGGGYATGGLVTPTPGGQRITAGEGGRPEYVLTEGQLAGIASSAAGAMTLSFGGISVVVQSIEDLGRVVGDALVRSLDSDPRVRDRVKSLRAA